MRFSKARFAEYLVTCLTLSLLEAVYTIFLYLYERESQTTKQGVSLLDGVCKYRRHLAPGLSSRSTSVSKVHRSRLYVPGLEIQSVG